MARSSTFILPRKARDIPPKDTGRANFPRDNTSTLISVDNDHDGVITADEGWFASLPIRVGDKMFDVVDIEREGNRIDVRPSATPVRGVVVGRMCPSFSFQ